MVYGDDELHLSVRGQTLEVLRRDRSRYEEAIVLDDYGGSWENYIALMGTDGTYADAVATQAAAHAR